MVASPWANHPSWFTVVRPLVVAVLASSVAACSSTLAWPPFGAVSDQADAPAGQVSDAAAVLVSYDIDGMLAQVAPIINNALAENLPAEVGPDARERLYAAVRAIYDPTVLTSETANRLLERARADQQVAALAEAAGMLYGPLPRRMVANEQAASTEEFAQGFTEFLSQPADPADAPRMREMRALMDSLHLVNLQIALNAGMLRGMVAGRDAVMPPPQRTSPKTLAHLLQDNRASLQKRLREHLPDMLFYAHRKVSDEDLATYLAMHKGPSLHWVNTVLPDVLTDTLTAAARRLLDRYQAE